MAGDKAAQMAGSQEPISLEKAGIAGLLGAGGEGVASAIGAGVRAASRPSVVSIGGQSTIQLAPEMLAALRKAGIDPSQVTQEWLQRFQAQAQKSLSGEEAARFTDLQTLPAPVPATRGDITRKPQDQMFEDQAFKGSYGERPAAVIQSMRGRQEDALRQNVDLLQGRLSGGVLQAPEVGAGGQIVSDTLNSMRDTAKRGVDDAYDAARNAGGQAGIPREALPGIAHDVRAAAADYAGAAPKAAMLGEELAALGGPEGADVTIRSLFDWRRRATKLRSTTLDPADAAAIGTMTKKFDEQMKSAIDQQLVRGDEEAVDRWLKANGMRAEFGKMYEGDDLVEKLVTREPRSGAVQLAIPADQAANQIFGMSSLRLGDANLARDLGRMRDLFRKSGNDAAWNALREEAFLRLFRQSEGGYVGSTGQRGFSGAKLATAIDSAMGKNKPLMEVLFSADELAQVEQVKRAALAVTTTNKGGQNFSNTASAAANLLQNTVGKMLSSLGGKFGTVLASTPLMRSAYNIGQGFKASARAPLGGTATPTTRAAIPRGVAGGLLGTAGTSPQTGLLPYLPTF
jgi:hypothetical protein